MNVIDRSLRDPQVSRLSERIKTETRELFHAENYKNFLDTLSRFYSYKPYNIVLIASQMKDAKCIAHLSDWKKLGRSIKKGEHGIDVVSPVKKNWLDPETKQLFINEETGKPYQIVDRYKADTLFDVSQTEGDELPEVVKESSRSDADLDKLEEALKETFPISFFVYDFDTSNKEDKLKHMVQKTVGTILTDYEINRMGTADKTVLMQIESVTYAVCKHFGVDTSDMSFDHIDEWSEGKSFSEMSDGIRHMQYMSEHIIKNLEEYKIIHEQPDKDKILEFKAERAYEMQEIEKRNERSRYEQLGECPYPVPAYDEEIDW